MSNKPVVITGGMTCGKTAALKAALRSVDMVMGVDDE